MLMLHYPTLLFLDPQTPTSLSYVFYCTFEFLETFSIFWFYSFPAYVSIAPQVMYSICFQHDSIVPQDMFIYPPLPPGYLSTMLPK